MSAEFERVTLEELLKLKRAERPPREFWTQFESELRAKQLAAIMARPPVWSRFGALMRSTLRHPIPLGAAAAVAVAWVGVREFRPSAPAAARRPALVQAPLASATPSVRVDRAPETGAGTALATPRTVAVETRAAPAKADDASVEVAAVRLLTGETAAPKTDAGWSSSLFAAPASSSSAEPRLAALVAPSMLAPARTVSAAVTREPLTRMQAAADDVRARLLEDDLPSASTAFASSLVSQRAANHLSDERLYRSISRYGVEGDHLLIKF